MTGSNGGSHKDVHYEFGCSLDHVSAQAGVVVEGRKVALHIQPIGGKTITIRFPFPEAEPAGVSLIGGAALGRGGL